MIAALAAGYQIIPCRLPSTRARKYVIESQLRGGILGAAVLASRMVAQKNILSRERTPFERNVDVFGKPNHRGCMNRELLRVEYVTIVFFHARYAFKDHHHCAPLGAHVNG